MNIKNRQGNCFSQHTLVNMLRNRKYCGFNVRGRFDSINLFGNQRYIMKKREEWVEMHNERIDPIISEELYDKVQSAISSRCQAGNKGKNISKTDLSGKIRCGKCGAKYILGADRRLNNQSSISYYICGHKKTRGKGYCDAKNIKKGDFDKFIDIQRTTVYPSSLTLNIKFQIKQLRKQISDIDKVDRYRLIKENENELNNLHEKLELLINRMLDDMGDNIQKIFKKKAEELENKIKAKEEEINVNQQVILDKERYKKQLDNKIIELEREKGTAYRELTREDYLKKVDKFIINSRDDIQVILK